MADETLDIEINYDVDIDDALDSLDELDDALEDNNESLGDTDRQAGNAGQGLGGVASSARSSLLPMLAATTVVGGLVVGLGALALGSAGAQNAMDSARAGVGRFVDAAVGPELEQAGNALSRIFEALAQSQDDLRADGERGGLGVLAGIPGVGLGAFATGAEEAQEGGSGLAGTILGGIRAYLGSSDAFERLYSGRLSPEEQASRDTAPNQTFTVAEQAPRQSIFEPPPIAAPRQSVLDLPPPGAGQAPTAVTVQQTFNGPITDLPTVKRLAEEGVRDALNDPTVRGGPLTGGSLP